MEFLDDEFDEILDIFKAESDEYIEKINKNLLKLENEPKNGEIINNLFRDAHSIKGASRMVGVGEAQDVAHKIEDIFGMIRDKEIDVSPEIIDVLCRATDKINIYIDEFIETKGNVVKASCTDVIVDLEKIHSGNQDEQAVNKSEKPKEKELDAEDIETLIQIKNFHNKISPLLKKAEQLLDALKTSSMDLDAIKAMSDVFHEIHEKSADFKYYEINELIGFIKMKFDSVISGSGIMIDPEVEDVEKAYLEMVALFDNSTKSLSDSQNDMLSSIDVIEDVINKAPQVTAPEKSKENKRIDAKIEINNIINKFETLKDKSVDGKDELNDILNISISLIDTSINEDVKKIIEKFIDIGILLKEKNQKPDPEIIDISIQGLNLVQNLLSVDNDDEDPVLILQHLSMVEQMLKFSQKEEIVEKEQDEVIETTEDQKPITTKQNKIIIKKEEAKAPSFKSSSGSTTIKTLRVDTKKLDKLVSQVGELIVAKIKTKEHLTETEKLLRYLDDWYRDTTKTKKMLKYSDKKAISSADMPSGTSIYAPTKTIESVVEEFTSKLLNFKTKLSSLQRTIHEDNTKLNLIVNELDESIKSVRVLPLATIFHMFPRMVRDIARDTHKQIELVISGSETSVDKKIIEEIKSPLIHIIRNSIDHGIESPEVRIKNGKNPVGKIMLSAYHLENSVLIEIIDDGHGVDLEKIKSKALQKGLLTEAELEAMSDSQIMNMIFWPGFSTGDVVTDISGRGIGLDVVHTKINQLNGTVNIESDLGVKCKTSIKLPVAMATIKVFLVKINDKTFAIPTNYVKTVSLVKSKDIFLKEGKETIIVDEKPVGVVKLSKILNIEQDETPKEKSIVVVVEREDVQVGFIIDKLIGDQEILHKNLNPPLLRVKNIAGVTTLGSGDICLIINTNDLIKSYSSTSCVCSTQDNINTVFVDDEESAKVLVVDDSVTTRILEKNILKNAGYNVTIAINGLDALTKINSEDFDIVISDVEMPEINGFELTERLRSDSVYDGLPIVLVTSLASETDKKKGLNLGANAYINKGSFNQQELLDTVRKLIN